MSRRNHGSGEEYIVWDDGIVDLHILADDVDEQTDDASIVLN